jgi:hypothetical protein
MHTQYVEIYFGYPQAKLRRHAFVDPVPSQAKRFFFFFAFSRPSIPDAGLSRIGIDPKMF